MRDAKRETKCRTLLSGSLDEKGRAVKERVGKSTELLFILF